MLVLVGVSDYRSDRENGDRTVRCDVDQADSPDELVCCGEITPSTRRARQPAAEGGSVHVRRSRLAEDHHYPVGCVLEGAPADRRRHRLAEDLEGDYTLN